MDYANGGSIAFPEEAATLFPRVGVGGGGASGLPGGRPHSPGVCFQIEPGPGGVLQAWERGRQPQRRRRRPFEALPPVHVCTLAGWEVHVWHSQIKTCQQA